jgi:hypothetical protein
MKKKISCALTLAAFLIGGAIIYYSISISLYTATEDLNEFPVPKNAELVQLNEQGLLKKTAFHMDMQWPLKRMDGKRGKVRALQFYT